MDKKFAQKWKNEQFWLKIYQGTKDWGWIHICSKITRFPVSNENDLKKLFDEIVQQKNYAGMGLNSKGQMVVIIFSYKDKYLQFILSWNDKGQCFSVTTAYLTTKGDIETKTKQSKMIFHGQKIFNKIEQALANRSVSGQFYSYDLDLSQQDCNALAKYNSVNIDFTKVALKIKWSN